jgi:UDP-N-acetylmuramoylalanine--D-glutamate ligase
MLYGLREYRGEPHRVEPIGVVNDVEYFDDSKGTNVGATVAALNGLGADAPGRHPGWRRQGAGLFAAGSAGGALRRAVVLIGRDAPLIRAALQGPVLPCSMPHAAEAVQLATPAGAHAG